MNFELSEHCGESASWNLAVLYDCAATVNGQLAMAALTASGIEVEDSSYFCERNAGRA